MHDVFICIQLIAEELQIVGIDEEKEKASKRVNPAFPSLTFNMSKKATEIYEEIGLWLSDNDVVGTEIHPRIQALFKFLHKMMVDYEKV